MKKLVALCGLSFAVLTAAATPQGQEEPRHNGKPLSVWVAQLKDKNIQTRTAAANALGQMGPQAKAAFPEAAQALKERAFEIWWAYVVHFDSTLPEKRSKKIGDALGELGGPKATPAEEIARLNAKVAGLEDEFAVLEKMLIGDQYILALATAMVKMDKNATGRLLGMEIEIKNQTTFSSVDSKIGPAIDDKSASKK